jgi:hypothetical protein
MNFEIFKSILIKSNRKIFFTGLVLLSIGIPMAIGSFFANNNKAGWIISIIFILLGLLIFIRSLSDFNKIKNDKLPLLYAIKNNQMDYLAWIYQKEIIGKVEGVKVSKSNNIVVCSKNNKHFEIVLSKKADPNEVITYLSNSFPKALIGFSEENKKEMELLWKKNKN